MNVNQKIAIITHDMFYGCPHALRDYLLSKKLKKLIFVSLPLVEQRKSSLTIYENGSQKFQKIIKQRIGGIIGFAIDLILTIYWLTALRQKIDLIIAVDPLNACSALILRKMGIVKKIIFYAMDFNPIRFNNRLLNYFFHKIEEICVKNSDEVWNVSPKIAEGREKFLNISQAKYPQKVVNSGIWMKRVRQFPFNKVKKHQLLFLGHLLKKQGLQMVLDATPSIVKEIPDFKFVIMGGGEYENSLKDRVKELNIKKYIEFKGWISNRAIIDTTLGESAAAIVLYVPEKEKLYNFSYYGDPIKLKEYLASGLPVILTDVPHNAREIEKNGCGIVVDYKKEEIANAVISMLKDEEKLKSYREKAVKYAKKFDWNNVFARALN